MKNSTLKNQALCLCFAVLLFSGCSSPGENTTAVVNPDYEIASPEYSELASKALTSWTNLDIDTWTSMMSDEVDFYFPDGDAGTRTKLTGKKEVAEWWNNWKQTSGIQSMTYKDHVDVPVIAKEVLAYSGLTGVFVFSYFSNEVNFNGTPVNLRMHVVTHFDSNRQIDRYYTYYDRTKIVELMGKNILTKEGE